MKLLYGTGNAAKLAAMRSGLESLDLEIIGLRDLHQTIPDVPEDGNTPLENATQKALAYYKTFHIPVFSCDSGLYFDDVPEEVQPGVHVRTVNGKCLSDEEMIDYYTGLAKKYGDLKARYCNAICLVLDEDHIYQAMDPDMESERFLITSKPHEYGVKEKGFPLDCLSIDIKTGKYYYDVEESEKVLTAIEDGFLRFFSEITCRH